MSAIDNGTTWNAGRFSLKLPPSASLSEQQQTLDGIDLAFKAPANQPIEAVLHARAAELHANPRTPVIAVKQWSSDAGAVIYVADTSDPTYYKVEGHRLLHDRSILAITGGDKEQADLAEKIVHDLVFNFVAENRSTGPGFGVQGGVIHQAFRNQEEVHSTFKLPELSAELEFNTGVLANPGTMDLFAREEETMQAAKASGVSAEVISKGHKDVAGQTGDEFIYSIVENGVKHYDARLETAGTPLSGSQPQIKLHFATDGPQASSVTQEQFVNTWHAIIDTVQPHP